MRVNTWTELKLPPRRYLCRDSLILLTSYYGPHPHSSHHAWTYGKVIVADHSREPYSVTVYRNYWVAPCQG